MAITAMSVTGVFGVLGTCASVVKSRLSLLWTTKLPSAAKALLPLGNDWVLKAGVLKRQHHVVCIGFGIYRRGHFAECHSEDDAHKGKDGGLQHTHTCLQPRIDCCQAVKKVEHASKGSLRQTRPRIASKSMPASTHVRQHVQIALSKSRDAFYLTDNKHLAMSNICCSIVASLLPTQVSNSN